MSKDKNEKLRNLTVTEMRKHSRRLNERIEYEIAVNEDLYKVEIDRVFRKTKQHKVIDDLISFFTESNEKPELLDITTPYMSMLLIKHFTNINIPDDVDGALDVLEVLIDLNLLGEILNLMPEKEVTNIYELLTTTVSRMKDNILDTYSEMSSAYGEVENEELKELLQKNIDIAEIDNLSEDSNEL